MTSCTVLADCTLKAGFGLEDSERIKTANMPLQLRRKEMGE